MTTAAAGPAGRMADGSPPQSRSTQSRSTQNPSTQSPSVQRSPARGRTTVAPQALDRTVSAVAADLFGVAARAVHVDLSDRNGLLALRVRTPIRMASLDRVKQVPSVAHGGHGTLLERAAEGQRAICERVTTLTGARVAHVTVELTGIETQKGRRVQ
jgi:hypothetical protein